MKLTKSKLKQIIKETVEEYPGEWGSTPTASLNTLEDALKSVLPVIRDAYDSLADDESKADFEDYLLKNVTMYVDKWREERERSEPTAAPTSSEPQHFGSHGEFLGATSTGPWEE